MAKLLITQVRSGVSRPHTQRATLRHLGLRRMHQTVERPDTPEIRGMVRKISHLLRVEQG